MTITEVNGSFTISATLTTTGFTATGVHIHREFAGQNGGVEITLVQDASDTSLWTAEASIDQSVNDLVNQAGFYFNAHSATNGGGEVRGQIVPEGYSVKHFTLDGSQEVPANASTATGFAAATVNITTGEIIVNASSDTANSTAAHVHQAAAGLNGGVIFALTRDAGDSNRWAATASLDTQAKMDAYTAGELYVNIHSQAFSGGEVRGQFPAGQ